jgi:periplasmic protein TonB
MKFLETEEEKKSFVITSIIFVLILILCFFLGMTYMDPPPENGIAINFGTSEFGSGEVQPMEDVRMSPQASQSSAQATPQVDDVLTQDVADAPVINKEKPKENVKPAEKPKVAPKPSQTTTDALNNLINGPETPGKTDQGQGKDGIPGDKGDPTGDRNSNGDAPGTGKGKGTGVGNYNLAGRKALNRPEPAGCNEAGTVTVQITVDNTGKVIKAETGRGTNASPCLISQAKAAAMKWKFDAGTSEKQVGTIVYNFKLTD